MAKIIKHPSIIDKKHNIRMLEILVNQYIKTDKKQALNKIKKEQ